MIHWALDLGIGQSIDAACVNIQIDMNFPTWYILSCWATCVRVPMYIREVTLSPVVKETQAALCTCPHVHWRRDCAAKDALQVLCQACVDMRYVKHLSVPILGVPEQGRSGGTLSCELFAKRSYSLDIAN